MAHGIGSRRHLNPVDLPRAVKFFNFLTHVRPRACKSDFSHSIEVRPYHSRFAYEILGLLRHTVSAYKPRHLEGRSLAKLLECFMIVSSCFNKLEDGLRA